MPRIMLKTFDHSMEYWCSLERLLFDQMYFDFALQSKLNVDNLRIKNSKYKKKIRLIFNELTYDYHLCMS